MHESTPGPHASADRPRTADTAVTVVVVTYNSSGAVARLLPTIDAGLEGVARWRLVVVDNASADGTPDLVRTSRPDAQVIETGRNAGYAAAINAGARHADPDDALLVLNPDVRLRPGCVRTLLDAAERPGTGIAVPRLLEADGSTAPSLRRDPRVRYAWAEGVLGGHRAARRGWSEVIREPAAYERERSVDWATGAAMLISADCRRAVGDWDESFFLYSEEVDYCQRARDAGYTVRYVPDAVAEHDGGPYGANVGLWKLVVRNRITHFARRNGPVRSHAFRLGVAAGQLLRAPFSAGARAGLAEALRTDVRPERAPGFVWFAAQDWWYHNRAHSDFQLMQQVARERPVLVVNSLGLRMPRKGVSTNPGRRITRKLRSMAKLVRRPVPGLPSYHVMTPIMLPAYGDTRAARANAWLIRQQVRLVARAIGVGPRPVIALTIPTAWPVVRPMSRSTLLFNRSDLHSAFPEAESGWVEELENRLLDNADRVLYVSHELMAVDRGRIGDRGVFLGHGVDLDHFALVDDPADPPELQDVPRPRIGFFGGLNGYNVDLPLLTETARALPEVSLILIGDANSPIDDLVALPNVHWLGRKPYDRIPELGRAFDVALMPWLDNEWMRFANPIKVREYLALGLPVVSTSYPEIRHDPLDVAVADDRSQFTELISAALRDPGDPGARRESVRASSWRSRAEALLEVADAVSRPGRLSR